MPIQIKGSIKRQVKVYGVPGMVNVVITDHNIEMHVPGTRHKIGASWLAIAKTMETPMEVPSYLAGHPVEFLQHQVKKKEQRTKQEGV